MLLRNTARNHQNFFRNTIPQIIMSILEDGRICNVSFSVICLAVQYWNPPFLLGAFFFFLEELKQDLCVVLPPPPAAEA